MVPECRRCCAVFFEKEVHVVSTITGRISSSNLNMQNIPRRSRYPVYTYCGVPVSKRLYSRLFTIAYGGPRGEWIKESLGVLTRPYINLYGVRNMYSQDVQHINYISRPRCTGRRL